MTQLYQSAVTRGLKKARHGKMRMVLPTGEATLFGSLDDRGDAIDLRIHSLDTFKMICLKGGIGLGESYQLGYWSTNDLRGLLEWFCANLSDIGSRGVPLFARLLSKAAKLADSFQHWRRRNHESQSERNIHAHYDLGNQFYRLFLDPSLAYSSAYFSSSTQSLEQAQTEKYDRLCKKLNLQESDHLLEIGCGWGGFALYAASRYGCRLTCVTISKNQFYEATRRVKLAKLQDRIEVRYEDYRKTEGKYDHIVSIEMLEAVGEGFLDGYFAQLHRLLAPNGLAAVQVITTPNPLYEVYRGRVDWIQKHIFPGSHLPSSRRLLTAAERGNLDILHLESFGLHYAKTLKLWRKRFIENWPLVDGQGFDQSFKRKWEFYLAYCEAGFRQRHINVMQMVFGRPDEQSYDFETRSGSLESNCHETELANAS